MYLILYSCLNYQCQYLYYILTSHDIMTPMTIDLLPLYYIYLYILHPAYYLLIVDYIIIVILITQIIRIITFLQCIIIYVYWFEIYHYLFFKPFFKRLLQCNTHYIPSSCLLFHCIIITYIYTQIKCNCTVLTCQIYVLADVINDNFSSRSYNVIT